MSTKEFLEKVKALTGNPDQIKEAAQALPEYKQHSKEINKIVAEKVEAYIRLEIETKITGGVSLEDAVELTWVLRRHEVLVPEMIEAAIDRGIKEVNGKINERDVKTAENRLADLAKLYVQDDRIGQLQEKVSGLIDKRKRLYQEAAGKEASKDLPGALSLLHQVEEFDITDKDVSQLRDKITATIQRKQDLKTFLTISAIVVGAALLVFLGYSIFRTTGTVVVFSDPVGAGVYVDGDHEGMTLRQGLALTLGTGKRQIKLVKPSYQDWVREVQVRKNQTDTLAGVMERLPAEFHIFSIPESADVFLDGKAKGKTPYLETNLRDGTYSLVLDREGYYRYKKEIEVRTGRIIQDTIRLVQKKETIKNSLIWIPSGRFTMGSTAGDKDEQPLHEVELTGFYISKYEVTIEQYKDYLNADPNSPDYYIEGINKVDEKWVVWEGHENYPVQVDWSRANAFCRFYGYRLPTEAEWEYACRAGSETEYCFGSKPDQLGDYAWFRDNSGGKVQKVGQKKANLLGLHDMYGNVFEWCDDWYFDWIYKFRKENEPCKNPPLSQKVPYDPSKRLKVRRGGTVRSPAGALRSATRSYAMPMTNSLMGFRYVKPKK